MIEHRHRRALVMTGLLLGGALVTAPLAGQDPTGVTLDFGERAPTAVSDGPIPDSVLAIALDRFNAPGTTRIYRGGGLINAAVNGDLGVYDGVVRVSSVIDGDVVVINGSLRLNATARVTGTITVLGGRFFADSGATYRRPVTEYRERAAVIQASDLRLVAAEPPPTLRDLAGQLSTTIGAVTITPHLAFGVYNRVEGLPIRVGGRAGWPIDPSSRLDLAADAIVRTSSAQGDSRSRLGWITSATYRRGTGDQLVLGVEASRQMLATADQPLSPDESSLSALIFRRDRRDWFDARSLRFTGQWRFRPTLTADASLGVARERSVTASEAFSILRNNDAWRPNPLIDDGRFTTIALGSTLDTRDQASHPTEGWFARGSVRRTTSGDLTPVLLPEQVRDPLPSDGYETWEMRLDVRRYQRLDPRYSIHARLLVDGWIGGDPLTIQRRQSLGGDDFLPGYPFKAVRCDPRRRPDPATPSLCDRQVMVQAELRRHTSLRLGSRVGPYAIGIDGADLLVFTDWGSAWIAGDGPGQVPANRLQSIREWRGDVGVGIDAGWFGAYLARAVTDDEPLRLSIRLSRRF